MYYKSLETSYTFPLGTLGLWGLGPCHSSSITEVAFPYKSGCLCLYG